MGRHLHREEYTTSFPACISISNTPVVESDIAPVQNIEHICCRNSRARTIALACLAISLCVLVAEFAFFWLNGNIDKALENAAYREQVILNEQYFSEHKGEKSAHEWGDEQGLSFSWGLMVPVFDDGVDEDVELSSIANSELSYVPDYIKSKFLEDGWQMLLTNEDLSAMYYKGEEQIYDPLSSENILGLTSPKKKTIFISADRYSASQACVHELGHYIDYSLGYPSQQQEFQDAMEADRTMYSFYFPYSHLDVDEEFYAEAFGAYWKRPDEIAAFCPELYEYFSSRF